MLSRRRLLQTCAVSLAAPTHAVRSDGLDTESHDLVVVGSGAAGLSAAVAAHREGLSDVLILEREPLIGGSSVVCGGQLSVAETNLQKSLGIHDSEELFFRRHDACGRISKRSRARARFYSGSQESV